MANESRSFKLPAEVSLEQVVQAVESFCKQKQMETQSAQTGTGYILQASQNDILRTASGTRTATTVQFTMNEDILNVTIGEGAWADKIGVAAVGVLFFLPIAALAGYGAYKQAQLPREIFDVINRTIMNKGFDPCSMTSAGTQDPTPAVRAAAPSVTCPKCASANPADALFCSHCGASLKCTCPECGQDVTPGSLFCSKCGKKLSDE